MHPTSPKALSLMMPKLIYGTAWKKDRTATLVETAVLAGFRGIDTACQPKHYQEDGVGTALSRLEKSGILRSEIFLQTKFTPIDGQDPSRVPYDAKANLSTQVAQSFASSQKNLGTDYVDSLVLHSPLNDARDFITVWQAMERIHDAGQALRLGISNCYDLGVMKWLFDQARIKPTILQNRFYQETHYDHELRVWCDAHAIAYQSFWTLTANPHLLTDKTLRNVASAHGKTEAQILFRFLIQIGITPLTGTSSERHMKEDLGIFEFELTNAELMKIAPLIA